MTDLADNAQTPEQNSQGTAEQDSLGALEQDSSENEERSHLEGEVGLGVDIVEIERMEAILERTPSFVRKVYSGEEQAYCLSKRRPAVQFAMRFAAKEAVVKALGTGFTQGIGVRDIEVARNKKGKPFVILHGRAQEVSQELGVLEIPLSLSYTHTEAVACAMAITEESVRVKEEKVNPMEELAQRFKEVRSLLDEADEALGKEGNDPA